MLGLYPEYALANYLIRFYGLRYTKEFTVESINLYMFYFLVRLCKEYNIKGVGYFNDITFKENGPLFDHFVLRRIYNLVPIDPETGFFIRKPENVTKEYIDLITKSSDYCHRIFKGKKYEKILHELIRIPEEDLISCYKDDSAVKNIRLKEHSFYHTSYRDTYTEVKDFTVFQLPEKLANITVSEMIIKEYNINLNTNQKTLIQRD